MQLVAVGKGVDFAQLARIVDKAGDTLAVILLSEVISHGRETLVHPLTNGYARHYDNEF